jgi:hypothetical protein
MVIATPTISISDMAKALLGPSKDELFAAEMSLPLSCVKTGFWTKLYRCQIAMGIALPGRRT